MYYYRLGTKKNKKKNFLRGLASPAPLLVVEPITKEQFPSLSGQTEEWSLLSRCTRRVPTFQTTSRHNQSSKFNLLKTMYIIRVVGAEL